MEILVTSYAGYRGDETPRRFRIGEKEHEVKEVVARWLEPGFRWFKVRGQDGGTYLLRQHVESWKWELVFRR
jgi:hypothetical protein